MNFKKRRCTIRLLPLVRIQRKTPAQVPSRPNQNRGDREPNRQRTEHQSRQRHHLIIPHDRGNRRQPHQHHRRRRHPVLHLVVDRVPRVAKTKMKHKKQRRGRQKRVPIRRHHHRARHRPQHRNCRPHHRKDQRRRNPLRIHPRRLRHRLPLRLQLPPHRPRRIKQRKHPTLQRQKEKQRPNRHLQPHHPRPSRHHRPARCQR
mmetsp:Transcript_985/g.2816  ORF Transcript_985/g.2816 Transcript_985/m.2816 type:complete len:203 (-) Transcript_985:231-839(-)